MKQALLVFIIAGILISGCAQRKVASSPETPSMATEKTREGETGGKKGPEKITDQRDLKIESKEKTPEAREVSDLFDDVHFDYDKYAIRADAKSVLKRVADYLVKKGSEKVLIEGHCDERGTTEYNLGLGDRRAKAAKDYLVSLGVPSSHINTISYGKEKPLCSLQTEDCWAKNRRDHFVLVKAAL
ncbi:MAG TPA: peptidoglycan-associated lipoprotein Pal [Thermodesulfovibrionales bacterium]|nr:peptidoglycan-associated lipoprotein Pal [Thermodesulfovibrionales bacterium]